MSLTSFQLRRITCKRTVLYLHYVPKGLLKAVNNSQSDLGGKQLNS